MKQYMAHYGSKVPFTASAFSNFSDACVFIKQQLDNGVPVRSISKEYQDVQQEDSREQLVKSVDILEDR